jgi:hypothetical protein
MSANHLLVIQSILASSASWRAKVTKTYQEDSRNTIAKHMLEQLAVQAAPEEVLALLDGFSDHEIQRETMAAAKAVGFKTFPGTLASFVSEVVERIKGSRAEWAQSFRKEGGR